LLLVISFPENNLFSTRNCILIALFYREVKEEFMIAKVFPILVFSLHFFCESLMRQ